MSISPVHYRISCLNPPVVSTFANIVWQPVALVNFYTISNAKILIIRHAFGVCRAKIA
jgi:hypothetical protein